MKTLEFYTPAGKSEAIVIQRYDAPREIVYRTYADPHLVPEWWGPRDLKTRVEKYEVRKGGQWRIIQRDSAGNEYAFHGVYHDVVPDTRIVRTFEFEGEPGHVFLETVTFEDEGGMTKVTDQSVFQSVEDRDGMAKEGMEKGSTESMERFNELLMKERVRV
jgi:uncharacterized protein YndB with AHSA1/START domain